VGLSPVRIYSLRRFDSKNRSTPKDFLEIFQLDEFRPSSPIVKNGLPGWIELATPRLAAVNAKLQVPASGVVSRSCLDRCRSQEAEHTYWHFSSSLGRWCGDSGLGTTREQHFDWLHSGVGVYDFGATQTG